MDITRIAGTICEAVDTQPQKLLDSYVVSIGVVEFEGFSNYCLTHGITITEDILTDMLASNEKYLFTESEDGWTPTPLDELESELDL